MKREEKDGRRSITRSGPAPWLTTNEPPRTSAPGPRSVVLAPARHMSSSLNAPQLEHTVESGTQSATHSSTLPTMSNAPRAETHALRAPVLSSVPSDPELQSVVPLSDPGSGVPFAAICHSALVGSRLPELAQASC